MNDTSTIAERSNYPFSSMTFRWTCRGCGLESGGHEAADVWRTFAAHVRECNLALTCEHRVPSTFRLYGFERLRPACGSCRTRTRK